MSTYTALVSRDGKFWHIDVPEIDRVTQARTINEVDDMARDLITIMTGLEPGSFELDVRIQLPDSVRAHLSEVERARDAEAEARPTQPPSFERPPPNSRTRDCPYANSAPSSESPTNAPASSQAEPAFPRSVAEPVDQCSTSMSTSSPFSPNRPVTAAARGTPPASFEPSNDLPGRRGTVRHT